MNYFTKGRVEAFSDGIFAIIVTLLVLEIKVPHIADHDSVGELAAQLWNLAPKVIAWMISFLTVCVIWVNHHRIFEVV
ncbi:MAG TPA: TMEM175 family protein, partial [Pyrinomonadaceae bacterium]|nr:TMEM175 family protein [Pyrinomonadaceae bacterium]